MQYAYALFARTFDDFTNMRRYFFLLVILLTSAIVATGPLRDPDMWWHIKTGELIVSTRTFPEKDIFAFTPSNRPWRAYSWIPALAFYAVSKIGNFPLIVFRIFLLTLISFLLYGVIVKITKNTQLSALSVFLGWCTSYPVWELRPHVFTLLFMVAVSSILALKEAERADYSLAFPAIFLMWANTHIYFPFGLFLIGAYLTLKFAARRVIDKKLAAVLAASALLTLVNPYGLKIYEQFFDLAGHSWTWYWVIEMSRPYPTDTRVFAFWIFVAVSVISLYHLRKSITFIPGFFILVAFAFSLTALKHIAYYAIISLPFMAVIYKNSGVKLPDLILSKLRAGIFIALLSMVFVFRISADIRKPVAESVPYLVAQYMKENKIEQPIANYFDFGGYFIMALWSEYSLFMDGRTQIYDQGFLDEYAILQSNEVVLEKAVEIFKKYNIKSIVWATDHPLTKALIESGLVEVIYQDKTAMILKFS